MFLFCACSPQRAYGSRLQGFVEGARMQARVSRDLSRRDSSKPRVSTLIFIHKSISAAKLLYREAVRDHSPGLPGLGFCQKEFALKAERAAECDDLSTCIARYSFSIRSHRSPPQGGFRWSFPRPEGLGCSVKPLRGLLKSTCV
jgi:hypothetical protein